MRGRLRLQNYYWTTLDTGSTIDNVSTSGSFNVVNKTVGDQTLPDGDYVFYITLDYGNSSSEDFRIYKVLKKTLYYDNRPPTKYAHIPGCAVQINTNASNFNYLSENTDDFGSVDVLSGLNVKVKGGLIYNGVDTTEVIDQTLTMINNDNNYIIIDYGTNGVISTITPEDYDNYPLAIVTTSGGEVQSITDKRSFINRGVPGQDGAPGVAGPAGRDGSIVNPNPGSTIPVVDINIPTGAEITHDTTWIKVFWPTKGGMYYDLFGRYTIDKDSKVVSSIADVGVMGDIGITYTSGLFVDKLTGASSFNNGNIAYKNQDNSFSGLNTFKTNTVFQGLVSFPFYNLYNPNTSIFDAVNGAKQKFEFSDGGTHVIHFANVVSGGNYVLAIAVTSAPAVLSFTGTTVTPSFDIYLAGDSGTDNENVNISLSVGNYIFIMEAFTTGIHIANLGRSRLVKLIP